MDTYRVGKSQGYHYRAQRLSNFITIYQNGEKWNCSLFLKSSDDIKKKKNLINRFK